MSWNIQDTLQHRPQGGVPREATLSPPGHPPVWDDTQALPTVAQAMEWDRGLDPDAPRWTLAEQEAMRAQGLIPERQWQAWSTLLTRGIAAL